MPPPGRYLDDTIAHLRKGIAKAEAPKKGEPAGAARRVESISVYVVDRFGGWQARVLAALAAMFDEATHSFPSNAMQQVAAWALGGGGGGWAGGRAAAQPAPACAVSLHVLGC